MSSQPTLPSNSTKITVGCNDIMGCGSFSLASGHAVNHDAFICQSIELLWHELAGLRGSPVPK